MYAPDVVIHAGDVYVQYTMRYHKGKESLTYHALIRDHMLVMSGLCDGPSVPFWADDSVNWDELVDSTYHLGNPLDPDNRIPEDGGN